MDSIIPYLNACKEVMVTLSARGTDITYIGDQMVYVLIHTHLDVPAKSQYQVFTYHLIFVLNLPQDFEKDSYEIYIRDSLF